MIRLMSAEIPRRAQRRSLALAAQYGPAGDLREPGEISNISTHGCCVKAESLPFRVGSHLIIEPEAMEPLGGTIRWIARDCAGVEFDHAIEGATVDHLVEMHQAGAQVLLSRG